MGLSQSAVKHVGTSKVRLLHNVAGAPQVDVYVDGHKKVKDVAYKDSTDFLVIGAGRHRLVVKAAGAKRSDKCLVAATVCVKRNMMYTLIVVGDLECGLAVVPVVDELEGTDQCPKPKFSDDKSYVRFIHAAKDVPAVDVWSKGGVEGDTKVFPNFDYKDASQYKAVDAGTIRLVVAPTDSLNPVLGPIDLSLEAGQLYTVVATGKLENEATPLDAVLLKDRDLAIVL